MNTAAPRSVGRIDWNTARNRLARLAEAVEAMGNLSAEQAKRIMDERARALSRASVLDDVDTSSVSVVEFSLSRETYAIETRYVHEIARFTHFTPLPGTPDFVIGATNHHGQVLAIFDLRKIIGIRVMPASDLARIVVCGDDVREFGILADAVTRVTAISDSALKAAHTTEENRSPFVRAITEDATIVLDGAALLQDPRLFVGRERSRTHASTTPKE